MESYPYNQKNVIKTLCSHNKDVFLDTLRRIIKEKRFEADYERVNLGVKIKCNGDEPKQCHHINGTCINGCDSGYQGPNCTEGNVRIVLAV